MNRYNIIIACLFLPFVFQAQGKLINSGAQIHIKSNTQVRTMGSVINKLTGVISNEGQLSLKGDWVQTDPSSSYQGLGWMTFNGNTAQMVIGSPSISKMRVDNGNIVGLGGSVLISDTLDLNNNGNIGLSTFDLTLDPSAQIIGYDTSSYIHTQNTGTVHWEVANGETKEFPVGLINFNPAVITNSGTTDVFKIRLEDAIVDLSSGNPIDSAAAQHTWHIAEEVSGGSDVTLGIHWRASANLPSFDADSCGISSAQNNTWDIPAFAAATQLSNGNLLRSRSNITYLQAFSVKSHPALTAISKVENFEANISLFPNPAIEYVVLNFELPVPQKATIQLLTIDGKVISQQNTVAYGPVRLDHISDLPSGTYLVHILLANGNFATKKFIKSGQ